jgi:hypothetical protein
MIEAAQLSKHTYRSTASQLLNVPPLLDGLRIVMQSYKEDFLQ